MNSEKFKPRNLIQTITLLCQARGGALLRNGAVNQTEIARLAGTSQVNISRWFKKENRPTDDSVALLAKAFKITPSQMRGESPINGIDGYATRSDEDEWLISEFNSLPDEAKNLIREQVKLYKKLSE